MHKYACPVENSISVYSYSFLFLLHAVGVGLRHNDGPDLKLSSVG